MQTQWLSTLMCGVLLTAAPTLLAQEPSCVGAERYLRTILRPVPEQSVSVRQSMLPDFPQVVFCSGARVPPFRRGHEATPVSAAVAVTTRDTLTIVTAEDLSRIWIFRSPVEIRTPRMALDVLLRLLDVTRLVPRQQVLQSSNRAKRRFEGSGINAQVLNEVRSPLAFQHDTTWTVRIYVDQTPGIVLYDFLIRADNTLFVSTQPYSTTLGI